MVPLIIILSVLALLVLILFLPVGVHIKFDGEFFAKIKILGIKIYKIEPQNDIEREKSDTESDKQAEESGEKLFKKLKDRLGFSGTVKEVFELIKSILEGLKKHLRHIAIRSVNLNIKVASDDAALTAIEYGVVCSTVYPVLSVLGNVGNIKYKKINIYSDFNSNEAVFDFSVIIRLQIIFLLITAFSVFKEYNNFKTRNEL